MNINDLPPLPDRRLFEYGETIAGYEARLAYAKELLECKLGKKSSAE